MAITIWHIHILLLCLVSSGTTTTGGSRSYNRANIEDSLPSRVSLLELHRGRSSSSDSPSQDALRPGALNNGLLGYPVFDLYGLLSGIRNTFTQKQVPDRRPSKAETHHGVLFILGDSLFDAGNNRHINNKTYPASNYPYGYTYFKNATGRVSDGRIVPDFIAQFADLPLIPASLQPGADFSYGANFASGGSAVLDEDRDTSINVINFGEQLRQFKEMVREFNETLGPDEAGEMLRRAVYLFSTGGNDYLEYYARVTDEGRVPTQAEQDQFVKDVVGNTTDALIELYEVGARKIAFQNVGPMGCLPSITAKLNGSCVQMLLSMSALHNAELYRALTDLADRLEGFKFSVMDYFSSLYDMITDPTNHGLEIGRTPCYVSEGDAYQGAKIFVGGNKTLCEYPSAYVFFDEAHTTQSANGQLAKLIWSGDPSVTRPYNVKQLFEED